jgi:hypothetical protein
MVEILATANKLRETAERDDVLIVWGGSNNISRNNMREAITNATDFVKNSRQSNIILMSAPHRHDLTQSSCVNKEVARFNSLMRKVIKQNSNTHFLEINSDRSHFTTHGMHMNSKCKDLTAQLLAKHIGSMTDPPQPPPPISIPWEMKSADVPTAMESSEEEDKPATTPISSGSESVNLSEESSTISVVEVTDDITNGSDPSDSNNRTSTRRKKIPSTRGNDFLWE